MMSFLQKKGDIISYIICNQNVSLAADIFLCQVW